MKDQITFDVTDADTIADSDKVLVHLFDPNSGNQGSINASNELLVKDGDVETAVQAVTSALGGTITVDQAAGSSIQLTDGTDTLAINADGSINVQSTISATDLDIRDLVAATDSVSAWTHDGAGNAIGSTTGSLDVNVTNSIDVDDGLANTAIKSVAETVTSTSAVIMDGADELAGRKHIAVYNNGNRKVFVGESGVTTSNGFPISPRSYMELRIGDAVDIHMVASGGSQDVRTMQLS